MTQIRKSDHFSSYFSSCRYKGLMQLRKLRNRTPALAELGERHMQCHATFDYNLYFGMCSWYAEARQAELSQESDRFRNSHGSTSQQNKGTVQFYMNITIDHIDYVPGIGNCSREQ